MKLLICTQALDKNHPILGFFHRWVEEFAKHCEVVHVICLQEGEHSLPTNVHVHSLGKEHGKNRLRELWRFYRIFSKLFFSRSIDQTLYHMNAIYCYAGLPFFLLRKFYGVKVYWWKAHGLLSNYNRFAGYLVDRVITSTPSGFPALPHKRKIVGQAIDAAQFVPSSASAHQKSVIFVGRLSLVKHLDIFCGVARTLRPEGFTFKVAGPFTAELDKTSLLKQFTEAGVEYIGSVNHDDLPAIYQQAAFFLNTSLTHSMDKTVLEAVLSGAIPLTANRAFEDLLSPHGLWFKEQTVGGYVETLRELAATDTSKLRTELRGTAASAHSIDTFFDRIFTHD